MVSSPNFVVDAFHQVKNFDLWLDMHQSFLKWKDRCIKIYVVKSHQNYSNLPNFDKYLAKGNEIVDLAAKMAVQNDLPQITQLRNSLEDRFGSHRTKWRSIINVVLAVGEIFSDENKTHVERNNHHEMVACAVPLPNEIAFQIDPSIFPSQMLSKCLWGTTYMAVLFSFLKNLRWVDCDESSYTMYLEIMISFQLVTGMEIPVAVPGIKQLVYQSPTVNCRLAKHPAGSGALQAFINSIYTTLR